MARIAYVDHSYHKKTMSTKFLADILVEHGHDVDWFWDESWAGGRVVQWKEIQDYDAIVMFQSFSPIFGDYYANRHPCVTYVPMLDQFGIWNGPLFNLTEFWEPFQGIKVLNFSNTLHAMTIGFGIKSKVVRYFQPTLSSIPVREGLHGFAWLRREDQVSWSLIKKLIGNTTFDSFHLHVTGDPGTKKITLPSDQETLYYNITISTWFEDKKDFEEILKQANVFFAARMEEGIGQSFLEALSRGQCVVAPNNGTMNEYIIDGMTGLLYDHERPEPLDFSCCSRIGELARESVRLGFKSWKMKEKEIVEYITVPNVEAYCGKYKHRQKKKKNAVSIVKKLKHKVRMFMLARGIING